MTKYIVTGPVVVLPTEDKNERYLYRGAHIEGGFTEAGIKHALGLGLIEKAPKGEDTSAGSTSDELPSDSWNHERIDAWAAAQSPALVFEGENLTKAQKLEQIAARLKK